MAVDPYKVEITCLRCNGTGLLPIGAQGANEDCPDCEGDGKLGEGTVEGAEQIAGLVNKVNDNADKLDDILEKLDE